MKEDKKKKKKSDAEEKDELKGPVPIRKSDETTEGE